MHLPTINYIDLSLFQNFPLSGLTPSVNLLRLDISLLGLYDPLEEDGSPDVVVQSEIMPKIREFKTSGSSLLTMKLLHAKRQDGRPAFNFVDLRRLSISFTQLEDEPIIRYFLQNAKLLEKLHLSVSLGLSLVGLLSPSARILRVLDLTTFLYRFPFPPLDGLCEELEAMTGHNMLEALSLDLEVEAYAHDTDDFIGSTFQNVEKVMVKPGWSALKQVSFKVSIILYGSNRAEELSEVLQSLPDKYLSHLPKLESIAFSYSTRLL